MKINKYIDHTVLKATASEGDISDLCDEAKKYEFYAVCVNGSYVSYAKKQLEGSDVKIASVIGFPLGASDKDVKIFEAKKAVQDGADEIDMVMNLSMFKSMRYIEVEQEIREIKEAINDKVLKVIIETCYLSPDEIILASQLAVNANADFVKTSTGFGSEGATEESLNLMIKAVEGRAQIKAAGGVRDIETAKKFIEMGVNRLGTSSGIALIKGETTENY